MKFEYAKSEYLTYITRDIQLAKTTLKTYKSGLNRYQRFLTVSGYVDPEVDVALDPATMRKYQYSLVARKLRPRTIHGAFDPLQALCKFLIDGDVFTTDPTLKLTLPKRDKPLRERMSDKEVHALFDAAERQVSATDVAQSTAILAMFLFSGVRADECAHIKEADLRFDFDPPRLTVDHGKGGKSRTVALPDRCVTLVKQWLAARKAMGCTHEYLWSSSPQRNVSADWLRADIEKVKAIAGFKGKANIKPHSMRHWYATNLMKNGATIRQIQYALGHADAKTTLIYLGIDEDDQNAIGELAVLRPLEKPPFESDATNSGNEAKTDCDATALSRRSSNRQAPKLLRVSRREWTSRQRGGTMIGSR